MKVRLTKKQAVAIFKNVLKSGPFPDVRKDKHAVREAFGIYIDSLQRDGKITMKQYESWSNPF